MMCRLRRPTISVCGPSCPTPGECRQERTQRQQLVPRNLQASLHADELVCLSAQTGGDGRQTTGPSHLEFGSQHALDPRLNPPLPSRDEQVCYCKHGQTHERVFAAECSLELSESNDGGSTDQGDGLCADEHERTT